jgi:hypothetical protein
MAPRRSRLYFRRSGYPFCIHLEGEVTTKWRLPTFIVLVLYIGRGHGSSLRLEDGEEKDIRNVGNTEYLYTVALLTNRIHI